MGGRGFGGGRELVPPDANLPAAKSLLDAARWKSWEDGKGRTTYRMNSMVVIEKSNKVWLCINPCNLNKAVNREPSPMKTGEAVAAKP